ncbi:MAG: Ig-like domain-containing protein, partial [Lachnospiraceae bacterium]|nr:Ig-like domain-containing protein [Lachnospiraceae bacterium]
LKVSKSVFRLAAGQKAKLKVKARKMSSAKKLLGKSHGAKLRFASTDSSVAVVSKKGAVTAVGPGTCDIWVYAQNGCGTRVTVTVS